MEPASGQGMQERERVQSTELGISGNACIHSGWYPQVISQAAAVCCLVHLYFTASAWLRYVLLGGCVVMALCLSFEPCTLVVTFAG
jgi:hypothetical protein